VPSMPLQWPRCAKAWAAQVLSLLEKPNKTSGKS
jgi:hypothetical protein